MAFIPKTNGGSRRFAAAIVDGIIVGVLSIPFSMFSSIIDGVFFRSENAELFAGILALVTSLLTWALTLFFLGWFYKNKGGTPGKLLFNLQAINLKTGGRMGYRQTFLRDFLGKALSGITLMIGYLMILFRKDRRGLHDLIANTQIIYVGPKEDADTL